MSREVSALVRGVVLALSLMVMSPGASSAAVYLNEYRHSLASTTDIIEIHNTGPGAADISGWIVRTTAGGDFTFGPGTTLAEGGYLAVDIGDRVDPIGGHIELIDDLISLQGSLPLLVDRVRFGTAGGAPAPPRLAGASLARVPDASANPPLAPNDDETWWTVDFTPTIGEVNDAQSPGLGASLLINEIRPGLGSAPDSAEVFNPLPFPVDLTNWFVSSARDTAPIGGGIPSGGFRAFAVPGLDLGATLRIDFFGPGAVRVDQKGIEGAPPANCYGSCPDGTSPSNGFDYLTSGGGINWFPVHCTLGGPNETLPGGGCEVSGVGDDEPLPEPTVDDVSWGTLKRRFR